MIIQRKLKGLASTGHNKWSFMCAIPLFLYSKSLLGQDLKQENLWSSYFIEMFRLGNLKLISIRAVRIRLARKLCHVKPWKIVCKPDFDAMN